MFQGLGFLKSKFSIFAKGEYRKHGFIEIGEIKSAISGKSAFSTWPFVSPAETNKSCAFETLFTRGEAGSIAYGIDPKLVQIGFPFTRVTLGIYPIS